MTPSFLLVFAASFTFIALRAFQQLNVVHDRRAMVVPTSLAMAFCEVYLIGTIALVGMDWRLVAMMGLGGGSGSICSMYLHRRIREWKK